MAENPSRTATPPKSSSTSLALVSVMLVAAIAVAGWFWYRSTSAQSASAAPTSPRSVLHLESFVVNLGSVGDNGYLRVGIDLGLDVELKEGPERAAYVVRLRDTILSILAARTTEQLLTAEGKTELKHDLLQAINARVPEVRCREIYFTEFLVQHG